MALSVSALSSSYSCMAPASRRVPLYSNGLSSRRQSVAVCCQVEPEQQKPQEQPVTAAPPPQSTPTPKPKTKVSTNFSDLLAFSGPAPERINGRLAMLGFVSALAVEAARGDSLLMQLTNGGLPWFLGTAVLFSAASLIPLFKGERAEVKNVGLMNADAEMWNGRFAMLGLVALAFTEYVTGGPLV